MLTRAEVDALNDFLDITILHFQQYTGMDKLNGARAYALLMEEAHSFLHMYPEYLDVYKKVKRRPKQPDLMESITELWSAIAMVLLSVFGDQNVYLDYWELYRVRTSMYEQFGFGTLVASLHKILEYGYFPDKEKSIRLVKEAYKLTIQADVSIEEMLQYRIRHHFDYKYRAVDSNWKGNDYVDTE